MNTLYGFRIDLPDIPFKDIPEEFVTDGIKFKIHVGMMEVGFDNPADVDKANKLAKLYIDAYALRLNKKIRLYRHSTWQPNTNAGRNISMGFFDTVPISERVQIGINGGISMTNQPFDSANFSNDTLIVEKAMRDPVLAEALNYFNEEVADSYRPLYGIYKALEVITHHLGRGNAGRRLLGRLAGQNEDFVSDVMQTTQTQRHAVSQAHRLLTDEECKERAKILLIAYADSIP